MCWQTGCTKAPTGKSREQLHTLLFKRAARGSWKNHYEEKAYRGPDYRAVQAWWEQCQEWMQYHNANVRHWSRTLKASCIHSGARKRTPVLRWMHVWNLAQRRQRRESTDQLPSFLPSCPLSSSLQFPLTFFFLHCRTSARHCRSTTGMSEERNQISPKAKANKNKHTNQTKQHPQKAKPGKDPGKFAN